MGEQQPSNDRPGDRGQWVAELFDRHAAALTLYARGLCDDPEDVVQEAFLKLSRERRAIENPAAWLFAVVRNEAKQAIRSRHRRRKRHKQASQIDPTRWFQQTADSIMVEEVTETLQQMDRDDREVITMRIWGELSLDHH